jgi:hypothetical protein
LESAVGVVGADAELVEQVREMLLNGCVGDDKFVCDGSCRCGFGEHVARQERPAERDEDVSFACGESRRGVFHVGWGLIGSGRVPKQEAGLADADLVVVADTAPRPDALSVQPGAVGGSQVGHTPACGEAFQHGVEMADRGIVERDVVLRSLSESSAIVSQLDSPAALGRHDLDGGRHAQ